MKCAAAECERPSPALITFFLYTAIVATVANSFFLFPLLARRAKTMPVPKFNLRVRIRTNTCEYVYVRVFQFSLFAESLANDRLNAIILVRTYTRSQNIPICTYAYTRYVSRYDATIHSNLRPAVLKDATYENVGHE